MGAVSLDPLVVEEAEGDPDAFGDRKAECPQCAFRRAGGMAMGGYAPLFSQGDGKTSTSPSTLERW